MGCKAKLLELILVSSNIKLHDRENRIDSGELRFEITASHSDPKLQDGVAVVETTVSVTLDGRADFELAEQVSVFEFDVEYVASFEISETEAGQLESDASFKDEASEEFVNRIYPVIRNYLAEILLQMGIKNVQLPWYLGLHLINEASN